MRRAAAGIYNEMLKDNKEVILPKAVPSVEHVYHVYAIRSRKRDVLFKELNAQGIGAIIHYPIPLHLQKAYAGLGYKEGDFPVAERVAKEIISLPMYPHIKKTEIKFVTDTIKKVLQG